MDHARVDLREPNIAGAAGAADAFGARLDGQHAVAVGARPAAVARGATSPRSWWARGARLVRNAILAVAVMTLVPIGYVAISGDHLARALYISNLSVSTRVARTAAVRSFMLPRDPSITPMQAGLALNALQHTPMKVPGFELIEPATRPTFPWRTNALSPEMFPTARPNLYGGPSSRSVLEAVAKGFTPREMEYLRALATAPVWRDFDLVARAPAVDIIGGQFKLPFGENALPEQRPLPAYRDARELAFAAVSRAAFYMSTGRRDEAERTLRSIVSFGFAYIDNGTSAIDEMIGTVIVGTGRDALQRFYVIEHDPRADVAALAPWLNEVRGVSSGRASAPLSADEARHRLLARLQDPAVPLGVRFESLRSLSASSCTNVRELMFGPRADVTDALEKARQSMARFPSEQALVALETRPPSATREYPSTGPIQSLVVSSASVAGVVLHNPRLVACTRMLSWGR
jgi:hypothetical protein